MGRASIDPPLWFSFGVRAAAVAVPAGRPRPCAHEFMGRPVMVWVSTWSLGKQPAKLPALAEAALELLHDTLLRGLWRLTGVIMAFGWRPGAEVPRNRLNNDN